MQRIAFPHPRHGLSLPSVRPSPVRSISIPRAQPSETAVGRVFAAPPAVEPAPRAPGGGRTGRVLAAASSRCCSAAPAVQRRNVSTAGAIGTSSHKRAGRHRLTKSRNRSGVPKAAQSIRATGVKRSTTPAARRRAPSSSIRKSASSISSRAAAAHALRHRRRPAGLHLGRHPARSRNKRQWPDWRPPPEMLRRRPRSAALHGGRPRQSARRARALSRLVALSHPRLQRALDDRHAVSSGCIRMRNEDVIDLY